MSALAELIAIVAPPACAACREPLEAADRLVCAVCVRALPWLRRPGCPRCALAVHRGGRCPAADAGFVRAWAPLAYDGVARDLVMALKFRGALALADVMAAQMSANLPGDLRACPAAVVPVPAHPGRRRRRGFDPAETLARPLAQRLGRPLEPCLRRAGGERQVGAGRSLRRRPDRLAVVADRPAPVCALLVDDVHTTGATLDACARALLDAGARTVAAVSYARTL